MTGHETSSSALTWMLYALARAPHIQQKLRESLRSLPLPTGPREMPTPADFQAVLDHPYLDACVRESLRLHTPITSTMRIAKKADVVPVSTPYRDRAGQVRNSIVLNVGDIVTVPIQAIHKAGTEWGEDAEEFRPERWVDGGRGQGEKGQGEAAVRRAIQGLWGGILTFGNGNIVDGNRSCIGYRFALNE